MIYRDVLSTQNQKYRYLDHKYKYSKTVDVTTLQAPWNIPEISQTIYGTPTQVAVIHVTVNSLHVINTNAWCY